MRDDNAARDRVWLKTYYGCMVAVGMLTCLITTALVFGLMYLARLPR